MNQDYPSSNTTGDGIDLPEGELSDGEPQHYLPLHTKINSPKTMAKTQNYKQSSIKPIHRIISPNERKSVGMQTDNRNDSGGGTSRIVFGLTGVVCLLGLFSMYLYFQQNDLKQHLANLPLKRDSPDLSQFVRRDELSDKIEQKFKRREEDAKQDISSLHNNLEMHSSKVRDLESRLTAGDGKLKSVGDELQKLPKIEQNITALQNNIQDTKEFKHKLEKSITQMESNINENIKSAEEKITDFVLTKSKDVKEDSERKWKMLDEEINTLKLEDVESLKQKKVEMEILISSLKESYENTRKNVEEVLLPNAFNKGSIMNAMIIIMVAGAMVWLYNRYSRHEYRNTTEVRQDDRMNRTDYHQPPPGLPAVHHRRVKLESRICVVRFSDNMHDLHTKLLTTILEGMPDKLAKRCPRVFHNIGSHDDIANLPSVRLYFLFVDYSERHVIIEEPGLGLGDFKRSTVQAIHQIYGDIVMIYLKDPSSRTLPGNARYNPEIRCVRSQEALSTLNQHGRFYSIYDTLTEFQKSCIQAIITDVFSG